MTNSALRLEKLSSAAVFDALAGDAGGINQLCASVFRNICK